MRKTIINTADTLLSHWPIRIKINQLIAISMSLSVDKFTSLRKASLLEQAKDAIAAVKKKQTSISQQECEIKKQYHTTNQYYKKDT